MKLDSEAKSNLLAQLYISHPDSKGLVKYITVDCSGEVWAWSEKPYFDDNSRLWYLENDKLGRGWLINKGDGPCENPIDMIFEVK